jgi:hypothetical protein
MTKTKRPDARNPQEFVDREDLDDLTYQPAADKEPAEETLMIREGLFGPNRRSLVDSLSALADAESEGQLLANSETTCGPEVHAAGLRDVEQ